MKTSNEIALKYVPYGLIDNMAALVQIMAWRRAGDKPLSEAMLVCFADAYMHHMASIAWMIYPLNHGIVQTYGILPMGYSVQYKVGQYHIC